MAYTFGASSYMHYTGPIITSAPLTMSCLFYAPDITTGLILMSIYEFGQHFGLEARGDIGGDLIRAVAWQPPTFVTASSSSGFLATTWTHAGGIFASSTSTQAFINGVGGTINTTSVSPTLSNPFNILGSRTSPGDASTVTLAECAMWNVALTAAEMSILAKGYSPLCLKNRLGNLKLYRDLIRDVNRPSVGPTMTNVSATIAEHPRIIYPNRRVVYTSPVIEISGGIILSNAFESSIIEDSISAGGATITYTLQRYNGSTWDDIESKTSLSIPFIFPTDGVYRIQAIASN